MLLLKEIILLNISKFYPCSYSYYIEYELYAIDKPLLITCWKLEFGDIKCYYELYGYCCYSSINIDWDYCYCNWDCDCDCDCDWDCYGNDDDIDYDYCYYDYVGYTLILFNKLWIDR